MEFISIYADLSSVFDEIDDKQLLLELYRREDYVLKDLEDCEPHVIKSLQIIAQGILEKAPTLLAKYEKSV